MSNHVVAPSLTPESYNISVSGHFGFLVVAPSLTPESYNTPQGESYGKAVVAPSLTPESYNKQLCGDARLAL